MINARRLTTGEAASALGVKPATLYAYVSRGVLQRQRSPSGSTFDAVEVARLARRSRRADPRREPGFVTGLTLIENGHLYYRGLDAVALSRSRSFEDVASWLWTGAWPADGPERSPWVAAPEGSAAVRTTMALAGPGADPLERFLVAVAAAALTDDLRHDLSAAAVEMVGRRLLPTLVAVLPRIGRSGSAGAKKKPTNPTASIAAELWPRLSRLPPTPERVKVLDAALVLSADHELAPSTLAARVAASFRADPYAVVCTGLGPASGNWEAGSTGAPGEVESLLEEARAAGMARAVGDRLRRRASAVHGFGMPLYPAGDPRGAELLRRLAEVMPRPDRMALVGELVALGEDRGFPPPNVDLGLGALSFCAEMVPGAAQAIATLGKVVGWLAHAMEEYAAPTRFRYRAGYVGPPAGGSEGETATA